jgi:hypothetical protein
MEFIQSLGPGLAVAAALVALPVLFWYATDNRVWDANGKRLPGMDSHYATDNFFTVLKPARRRKCASTVGPCCQLS